MKTKQSGVSAESGRNIKHVNIAKKIIPAILLVALVGCASNSIQKSSDNLVYMSKLKAPASCKYLGEIYGGHKMENIGMNPKLVAKDISELHIKRARVLGGNYVEMNASMNGGKAYSCPMSALQQLEKSDQ